MVKSSIARSSTEKRAKGWCASLTRMTETLRRFARPCSLSGAGASCQKENAGEPPRGDDVPSWPVKLDAAEASEFARARRSSPPKAAAPGEPRGRRRASRAATLAEDAAAAGAAGCETPESLCAMASTVARIGRRT